MKKKLMIAALLAGTVLSVSAMTALAEEGKATFYLNIEDSEEIYEEDSFTLGEWVAEPTDPELEGKVFDGWYKDADCTEKFSFNDRVDENVDLYAYWKNSFTFEAEYVNLDGMLGQGYSGNTCGTGLIMEDKSDAGASNGYYVSCLYYDGAYLSFDIQSDRDVDDVTMVLRLSAEFDDMIFTGDDYLAVVNGEEYNVEAELTGAYSVTDDGENKKRPFTDHIVANNISLKEGENVIELVTNNDEHMSGATMDAKAPMVDCMYLYTSAELSWEPVLDNIK